MSITAVSFYWRNDTPSFVTWRSRLATAPDTPTCIVIHGDQFTGGVHPLNQFVPETVSPLPCSHGLVRHTLLIVYFFIELISFIGCLDNSHSSVFNALINCIISDISVVLRENTLFQIPIETGSPVESEKGKVVSPSTTAMTEITRFKTTHCECRTKPP